MEESSLPFNILINASSGAAAQLQEKDIVAAVHDSGLPADKILYSPSEAFKEQLKELSTLENPLLIGGGDGTQAMASQLMFKQKKPFGILPFGTMNMLARDLNIPLVLNEMFKAYVNHKTLAIDIALVGHRPFLCASALGLIPEASELRESMRDQSDIIAMPKLGSFIFNELDPSSRKRMRLVIDGVERDIKVSAILISNNQYSQIQEEKDYHFKRGSLTDGVLGIYTLAPKSFWEKIRFLLRLNTKAWKKDPAIKEYVGREVIIKTDQKKELISIDGEPEEVEVPLVIKILPKAMNIIVPGK